MFYICTRKYELLTIICSIMENKVTKPTYHSFLVKVIYSCVKALTFRVDLYGTEFECLSSLMCISRGTLDYVNGSRVKVICSDGKEIFSFVK